MFNFNLFLFALVPFSVSQVPSITSLADLDSHLVNYFNHYSTSIMKNLHFTAVITHEHAVMSHIHSDARWCIKHSYFFLEETPAFKKFTDTLSSTVDFSDTQRPTATFDTISILSYHAMRVLYDVENNWNVVINATSQSIISHKLNAFFDKLLQDQIAVESHLSPLDPITPDSNTDFFQEFSIAFQTLLTKTIYLFMPTGPQHQTLLKLPMIQVDAIIANFSWSLRYFTTTLEKLADLSAEKEWWVNEEFVYSVMLWETHIDDLRTDLSKKL